jgi:adenylate cyclase class 2
MSPRSHGIMHYEVELKFRSDDLERVRGALEALGAVPGEAVDQTDAYYRHPVRDFSQTDEAFRLRRVGQRNVMTYKGPKVDATTKTRYEREASLADGEEAFRAADDIVRRLGFEPVAEVRKRRRTLELDWQGLPVEAALDEVAGVGSFVELEASVDAPDQNSTALDSARRVLIELAEQLGLRESERRSYLELLLAAPS